MKLASIAPRTGTFSDPPTQSEMQDYAADVESLRPRNNSLRTA